MGSSARANKGVRSLAAGGKISTMNTMSMSIDQIVAEVRQLPKEKKTELFDLLLVETFAQPDPEIDAAWRIETRRRIAEIEGGQVKGIPGEQVMAELRQIVGL